MENIENTAIINTDELNFEGIRLRNTQKGYTWDIKIKGFDIEKLKQIDKELKTEWGNVLE